MRLIYKIFLSLILSFLLTATGRAQDSLKNNQIDLVDVGRSWLKGHRTKRIDTVAQKEGKLHISALPIAGYTLQTGFAGVLSSNFAFYTSEHSQANMSSVLTSITYSQYEQIILPVQADIWTRGNKYNIVTDWRFLKYPSQTYGLGGNTSVDSGYNINYGYLRLHQAILRSVTRDLYLGLGYDFDYFWNIKEVDPPPAPARPPILSATGLPTRRPPQASPPTCSLTAAGIPLIPKKATTPA
ncbi:hypothetical protein ACQ86N_32170 [Puia sp. P3]|uniref:hypothetical protein n=1 Tax=Puia sp. P3 TaxID=3423952 RepID=UPI003D676C89